MFDRIPENPGRVKITPENGGAAYYATMERADNPTQEGTPINKATLLTDETAAFLGLGADAVPDDAFFVVANNLLNYRWKKTAASFTETHTANGNNVTLYSGNVVYYSDKITVDKQGKAHLLDPLSVNVVANSATTAYNTINNKYIMAVGGGGTSGTFNKNEVYYFVGTSASASQFAGNFKPLTITLKMSDGFEIAYSVSESEYQNGLLVDGYIYELIGRLSDANCRMAVGTYKGTGTYGKANAMSLTFDFVPKLLLITGSWESRGIDGVPYNNLTGMTNSANDIHNLFIHLHGFSTAEQEMNIAQNTPIYVYSSADGKTVYWYATNSQYGIYQQMNYSSYTYRYIAIG